jgi:FtsP/CotA-like multicopper oxidase with cupredoxin domain
MFRVVVSRLSALPWRRATAVVAILAGCSTTALAGDFVEPAVFASHDGVLDLLMIAKAQPVPSLSFVPPSGGSAINPVGWVYEVCRRPAGVDECPTGPSTVADYGGVRLALQKGDTLKIHLVNQLPKLDPNKLTHSVDPGEANLYLNPTNIHTHGLLVQARAPTLRRPSFGDYVFVSVYNSANGMPVPQNTHQHGPIVMGSVDYQIDIPRNHPSGQFWFHPHMHGLALNQVTEGLAGIISIGSAGDYAHGDADDQPFPDEKVRHLILKDIQVQAAGTQQFVNATATVQDGEVRYQPDPAFCAQFPADASEVRQGSCPGAADTGDNDYTGGKWYFTVNGQQFPTVRMTSADGEIWRLTNASGSVSYDLQLVDDSTKKPITVQLLAVDGVSVHLPQDATMGTIQEIAGGKFRVVPCPAAPTVGGHGFGLQSQPVCVSEVVMMPSSRTEFWVAYRDAEGRVATPPAGASATLKMIGLTMGSGDAWPAVDLAKVEFQPGGQRHHMRYAMNIRGDALSAMQSTGIFSAPVPYAKAAPLPPGCAALAKGHRRRIFFGFEDVTVNNTFGLGYEELDEHGVPVPGTYVPVSRFDPSKNSICLPLGPGQTPVHESWELVQLSTENHNFHIHQSRFRKIDASAAPHSPLHEQLDPSVGAGIVQDNLPLGVAVPDATIQDQVTNNQNGVCTVDQWRSGHCASTPVVVDIPFAELGEFVYHCHILEHEDGGMMAKIQVVPSPY